MRAPYSNLLPPPAARPRPDLASFGIAGRALQAIEKDKPWLRPPSKLDRIAHLGHYRVNMERLRRLGPFSSAPTPPLDIVPIELAPWLAQLREMSIGQEKKHLSHLVLGFINLLRAAGIHGPTAAISHVSAFDPLGEGRALAQASVLTPNLIVIPVIGETGPIFHLQHESDWIQLPAVKLLAAPSRWNSAFSLHDKYLQAVNVVAYGLAAVVYVAGLADIANQRAELFRIVPTAKERVNPDEVRCWCAWYDLACEALENIETQIGSA